jgi:hypothetical protein
MRRSILGCILIISVLLSACTPGAKFQAKQVDSESHFFETTPTSSVIKGSDEELAKALPTATKHSSYPTPKSTYLAPSTLVTYADPGNATATPKATNTYTPQPTSAFTSTATQIKATNTPTQATATPTLLSYDYAIQSGTPVSIQNFVNSSAGCSWQGIAGQVFNSAGTPQLNIVVKAGGIWNGATVSQIALTGLSTGYGEGGYELVLGIKALDTTSTVWVQIFDVGGNALSDKVYISTSSDCTKNLVLLNFKQISE